MKKRWFPVLLVLVFVLGLVASAPGQLSQASVLAQAGVNANQADWPLYGHDNQRTNYNPAEKTLAESNVSQLVQRWQMKVGSNGVPGSAAPSVSNGFVYVASSAPSPDNNFFAFSATSGAQVWAKAIGYHGVSCFNVGVGGTPAVSGSVVVMGSDDAKTPAYFDFNTADGSQVWSNAMGVGSSGFPWESPFIFNGRAYVGISSRCDNPSVRGELRAIDMASGKTVASSFVVGAGERGGGIWNSAALSPDGTIIAFGTGEDYSCTDCSLTRSMMTVDANTLATLQHFQEPSPNRDLDFGTSTIFFHDSKNRTLVAAGHKNGTFYAYDVTNIKGGPIWSSSSGGTSVGLMPAYDPSFGSGGTLFIVNGNITAVDPASGDVRWGPVDIPTSHGNIAIANGLIFVNAGASGLQVRRESDGSLLRTITPANAGAANSGVAVSNGFIYWLSGSYVNAWSLPAGTSPTPTTGSGAPTIPGSGSVKFPETGKTVSGIFLDYWNNHGGLAQQGYPISDLMREVSDLDGKTYTVQYFERAVFEYHPENAVPNNVLLSQLGTTRYKAKYSNGAPNQTPNTSSGSQLFAQTNHRVGGKFLDYWNNHGGLAQQGYPISDEFQEKSDTDGKTYTVQYFERAVFEAHPENQSPYDVLLSLLGRFQYTAKYGGGAR